MRSSNFSARIIKIGNARGFTVPTAILKNLNLGLGDEAEVIVLKIDLSTEKGVVKK